MPKTTEDLLAEAEIKDVHIRFCRANDRRDEDLMRSCFHPDAVIDLHETLDVEGFLALGRSILSRYVATWHNTGNQLVEVAGNAAWAEHYITSSHRIAGTDDAPARDLVAWGRYVDRMEKRDGAWRIARRAMAIDFTRLDPVPDFTPDLVGRVGTRDKSDLSYAMRLEP